MYSSNNVLYISQYLQIYNVYNNYEYDTSTHVTCSRLSVSRKSRDT